MEFLSDSQRAYIRRLEAAQARAPSRSRSPPARPFSTRSAAAQALRVAADHLDRAAPTTEDFQFLHGRLADVEQDVLNLRLADSGAVRELR